MRLARAADSASVSSSDSVPKFGPEASIVSPNATASSW
jgi:hypothetical protein